MTKADMNHPLSINLTQARSIVCRMRETVEDIEEARTSERAKTAHGNKPRIPWAQVKKETGLE